MVTVAAVAVELDPLEVTQAETVSLTTTVPLVAVQAAAFFEYPYPVSPVTEMADPALIPATVMALQVLAVDRAMFVSSVNVKASGVVSLPPPVTTPVPERAAPVLAMFGPE